MLLSTHPLVTPGLLLSRVLAISPALIVLVQGILIGPRFDRFVLPAFDGYVYAAMAENPHVFTMAPWGYRILMPWLVGLFPFPSAAAGFFWLNLLFLSGSVFLLQAWLRRLGFSPIAAALGGLALAISPPLSRLLGYQVLVDSLTLLIMVAVLHELVNPRWLALSGLFALGAITKEMCLLPLALVPFALSRRMGWKRSLLQSSAVVAPAIGLVVLLHLTWGTDPPRGAEALWPLMFQRATDTPVALAKAALLSGLTLVALFGLRRERSVEIRAIGIFLGLGTFLAVLANPYHFSPADLPRISLFAWPALLPLALVGLGFTRARLTMPPPTLSRAHRLVSIGAVAGALALVLGTDSYRRPPPVTPTNPIAFHAQSRETLKTARALDEGQAFVFDSRSGRFAAPVQERFNLTEGRRQRFFLHTGFGPDAAFKSGAPEFLGDAELLVPILRPRDGTASFELQGPAVSVAIAVNGLNLGSVLTDGRSSSLSLPAEALFRGDNVLRMRAPNHTPIRLVRFELRLALGLALAAAAARRVARRRSESVGHRTAETLSETQGWPGGFAFAQPPPPLCRPRARAWTGALFERPIVATVSCS